MPEQLLKVPRSASPVARAGAGDISERELSRERHNLQTTPPAWVYFTGIPATMPIPHIIINKKWELFPIPLLLLNCSVCRRAMQFAIRLPGLCWRSNIRGKISKFLWNFDMQLIKKWVSLINFLNNNQFERIRHSVHKFCYLAYIL